MDHQRRWFTNNTYHQCIICTTGIVYVKKITWNFHVDDPQESARYGMIMGRNVLLELQIDLCLSYLQLGETEALTKDVMLQWET